MLSLFPNQLAFHAADQGKGTWMDATKNQSSEDKKGDEKLGLSSIAISVTIAATLGSLLLFWMGACVRSAYLGGLGVNAEGFERTRDSIIELGASTMFYKSGDVLDAMAEHVWISLFIAIITFCSCFSYFFPFSSPRKTLSPKKLAVARSLLFGISAPMASIILMGSVVLALGIPAYAGSAQGLGLAEELRIKACTEDFYQPCQELWLKGEMIGNGTLVAESPTRIAFFDVCKRVTITMDVAGTEMRSRDKFLSGDSLKMYCNAKS